LKYSPLDKRENKMEIKNIDDVLDKIEAMHTSIKLSDEIFPVISDLFLFVKAIIPLMLEVNSFMNDSSKKIPTASDNINSVSKATEMAANDVMNRLDLISEKLDTLRERNTAEGASKESIELIDEISGEANEIIFAFQFQDITTQQLEHVNRILSPIYEKFITLFQTSLKLKDKSILGKDVVAALENEMGEKRKEDSEEFHKKTEDKMHHGGISQDAIDKFFK
jgi:chemotaxis regulatin CheY-phosphate phosphatase CheZ